MFNPLSCISSASSHCAKFLERLVIFDASTSIWCLLFMHHNLAFIPSFYSSFPQRSLRVSALVYVAAYQVWFDSNASNCVCAALDSGWLWNHFPPLFGWVANVEVAPKLPYLALLSYLTLDKLPSFHAGFCCDFYTLMSLYKLSSLWCSLAYMSPDESSVFSLGWALVTSESTFFLSLQFSFFLCLGPSLGEQHHYLPIHSR